ncbi:hypothetical protein OG819_50825 [Streptomyces sp. NBC_01549]|uniref:hypothetical protein n=1 Tax=Streptomyces sp. NBC_01549 TaxID=2975874 RepID=UPI0022527806|nr:hypothetical protein [Streptomyces sp. NBC_01549]MCX4597571.1 hypothetical protein [Streptomyces sp. NBC_01549]
MPLPDEDFPLNNPDLGVPWQAVVARMDLVRVAIVVERLEIDGADRRSVSDVLLRIGGFCHVGQYLRVLGRPFGAGITRRDFAAAVLTFDGLEQRREADPGDAVGAFDTVAPADRARRGLEVLVASQAPARFTSPSPGSMMVSLLPHLAQ